MDIPLKQIDDRADPVDRFDQSISSEREGLMTISSNRCQSPRCQQIQIMAKCVALILSYSFLALFGGLVWMAIMMMDVSCVCELILLGFPLMIAILIIGVSRPLNFPWTYFCKMSLLLSIIMLLLGTTISEFIIYAKVNQELTAYWEDYSKLNQTYYHLEEICQENMTNPAFISTQADCYLCHTLVTRYTPFEEVFWNDTTNWINGYNLTLDPEWWAIFSTTPIVANQSQTVWPCDSPLPTGMARELFLTYRAIFGITPPLTLIPTLGQDCFYLTGHVSYQFDLSGSCRIDHPINPKALVKPCLNQSFFDYLIWYQIELSMAESARDDLPYPKDGHHSGTTRFVLLAVTLGLIFTLGLIYRSYRAYRKGLDRF